MPDGRRRPADVLVCTASAFPRVLPDGSQGHRQPRIAFDFAVINALGRDHWVKTSDTPGSAVEAYAEKKRSHQDTAKKCDDAGVLFQPLVFDAQGGMTTEAGVVIHQLASALASAENLQPSVCKEEMMQKFALIISRAGAKSVLRRRQGPELVGETACRRACSEATVLEV